MQTVVYFLVSLGKSTQCIKKQVQVLHKLYKKRYKSPCFDSYALRFGMFHNIVDGVQHGVTGPSVLCMYDHTKRSLLYM